MGNSDHSYPAHAKPATSLTAAAPLWRAFMREYTKKWPITAFKRPKDVVEAKIDAWSGGRPGPWTRDTTTEWFIKGTQPGAGKAIDKPGLLYRIACGSWRVDPVKAELGPASWRIDVADWLRRAFRGPGAWSAASIPRRRISGTRAHGAARLPAPAHGHGSNVATATAAAVGGRDGGDHKKKPKPPKPVQPGPTPPPSDGP
jgi:hypothetical protein